MVLLRRPPKRIAEIGTPRGSFAYRESFLLLLSGTVKRLFGCAAGSFEPTFHGRPRQSMRSVDGLSMPSHQMSMSGVSATLVKIVSCFTMSIAFGFVWSFVP